MREALERSGQPLMNRLFTTAEQVRCKRRRDPVPCFANRFAAKEALAKALGVGLGPMGITNAEVTNDERGAPVFQFHGRLQDWFDSNPGVRIHLSLSDGELHATALVIVECDRQVPWPPPELLAGQG